MDVRPALPHLKHLDRPKAVYNLKQLRRANEEAQAIAEDQRKEELANHHFNRMKESVVTFKPPPPRQAAGQHRPGANATNEEANFPPPTYPGPKDLEYHD